MDENVCHMVPDVRNGPCPTVMLLHDLPDGSWHVDWMMAREAERERPLVSFRLPQALTDGSAGETVVAEHIGDHRPAYLHYEGPVSGNRGQVRRLRSGCVTHVKQLADDKSCRLRVNWHADAGCDAVFQHLEIVREENALWAVKILESTPRADTIIR